MPPRSRFPPHPDKPWLEATPEEIRALFDRGTPFFDARRSSVYRDGHIRGARSLSVWEAGLDGNSQSLAQPRTHVAADVMEKLVTHRVDPEYPAAARPGKLQGVILLDVVVGRDGSVVETRALNGPGILAQAAMDAMRWWRFEPYRVDGQPVVAETTVAVEFKP